MKPPPRFLDEALKILEVILLVLIIPTACLYTISLKHPQILDIAYHVIVTMMLLQACITYWHVTSVIKKRRFVPGPLSHNKPVPKTTFIVTAYLPNEISVIEATVLNLLRNVERPEEGIEVILAYNTPHMEPMELRLREMAYNWPELILANAFESKGKSENLNYAIDLASGEMIVLLDSDHLVDPDCLKRAWRWLDQGYDVTQGRCKVRNGAESFVSRMVEIEFETIYAIQHAAKSIIFDTSLFGGSNGYWKAKALKEVKFRENMLTEDIDSTLRATLAGYRFVHDRSIVSTELAPTKVTGLWFQRKRWAQGWFECSLKYQLPIWKTDFLNPAQKFMWTTLLAWRVFYDLSTNLLFAVLFAFWLYLRKVELPLDPYIAFALVFTLFSGPYLALAAFLNSTPPRAPFLRYLNYAVFVWPYTIFKALVHMVSIRDEFSGEHKWIVSERPSTAS